MRSKLILMLILSILLPLSAFAATKKVALPKKETVEIRKDKKGKISQWMYRRNGVLVKTEYDRNGDGKPDLRVVQHGQRFIRKEYDDNFDGQFEKIEKAHI